MLRLGLAQGKKRAGPYDPAVAHVRESVRSPRPQAEVLAYLSDFTTTAEWDPGVKDAEQLTDGPVAVGTGCVSSPCSWAAGLSSSTR